VPDVRPYLAQAAVVIAPLRIARGLQNKVLEAMAMGKATVASHQALAGFASKLEVPVLSAASPAEWIEAILRLLQDPSLRCDLGAACRRYVEAKHCWDSCLAPFDELLSRTPGPASRRSKSRPKAEMCIDTP
jgi:glycosyltransferase involved in cell wall biosynthesis